MSSALISDGYNENGFIAEVPRLHPSLRFVYRPFLQEERNKLLEDNGKLKQNDAVKNTSEKFAGKGGKIKSWDLQENGEPVAVTADNFRRLKIALYGRIVGIVMGLDPSDEDPNAKPVEDDSPSLFDKLESVETGKPIGDVVEAHNAKN